MWGWLYCARFSARVHFLPLSRPPFLFLHLLLRIYTAQWERTLLVATFDVAQLSQVICA